MSGVERHRSAANMRTGQKPPIEPAAHRSGGGRARRDNPRAITRLWLAGCESPLHYCPPSGLDDGPTPARRSTARYANAFLLASSMQLTPRALGCTEGGARHPPRSGCSRTGVGSRTRRTLTRSGWDSSKASRLPVTALLVCSPTLILPSAASGTSILRGCFPQGVYCTQPGFKVVPTGGTKGHHSNRTPARLSVEACSSPSSAGSSPSGSTRTTRLRASRDQRS